MIKAIRRFTILTIGVGAGFGAGYLKATNDLDPEFLHEMRKLVRDFYDQIAEAVRSDIEENRKQTEIFATTAAAVRDAVKQQTEVPEEDETTEPGETP